MDTTQKQSAGLIISGGLALGVLFTTQIISGVGSELADFVIGLWAFMRSGQVWQYATVMLLIVVPTAMAALLGGAIADHFDRRFALILTDLTVALGAVILLILIRMGIAAPFHIFVLVGLRSLLGGMQGPIMESLTPMVVPKDQLSRVNGLIQTGFSVTLIVGPVLGGFAFQRIGINGALIVDIATFGVALLGTLTLYTSRFDFGQRAEELDEDVAELSAFRPASIAEGARFLLADRGLAQLVLVTVVSYLMQGIVIALYVPMVLGFTDSATLGVMFGISFVGAAVGGIGISILPTPKRQIQAILLLKIGVGAALILGGLRPSVGLVVVGGFAFWVFQIASTSLTIAFWQTITPTAIMGRVQAWRQASGWMALGVSILGAGVLADAVFGPAMMPGGGLAPLLGPVFGLGDGRGIGVLFALSGVLLIAFGLLALTLNPLRTLDDRANIEEDSV